MAPKRILFFCPTASIGGAERNLLVMCEGLVDRGHVCAVVLPPNGPLPDALRAIGVTPFLFPEKEIRAGQFFRVLWNCFKLRPVFKSFKPDIIHCNSIFGLYLPVILGSITRTPSVVHWADFDARIGDIQLINFTYPRNKVIAVSAAIEKTLIGAGAKPNIITTIHNGTPIPETSPDTRHDIATEFSLPESAKWVGITGRIDHWKGHRYLVDAMAQVTDLPVHLIILGGGALGDNRYETEIKDQIQRLHLTDRVSFTGFQPTPSRIVQWMDIVVCPSDNEPFGLVAIEAMMHKKPVIASNMGGFRETILHKKTGFLVPPKSPEHIAKHLRTLVTQPELAIGLGQAGFQRAMTLFSLTPFIDRLEAYYEQQM